MGLVFSDIQTLEMFPKAKSYANICTLGGVEFPDAKSSLMRPVRKWQRQRSGRPPGRATMGDNRNRSLFASVVRLLGSLRGRHQMGRPYLSGIIRAKVC